MKVSRLAPMAALAMMAFSISTASSQPAACGNEYVACMDTCAGRKGAQDSCFKSCESQNNMCSERVYGKRPFNGAVSTAAEQSGRAKDAMAKDKGPEPQAPQSQTPEPAQQRAPARR